MVNYCSWDVLPHGISWVYLCPNSSDIFYLKFFFCCLFTIINKFLFCILTNVKFGFVSITTIFISFKIHVPCTIMGSL